MTAKELIAKLQAVDPDTPIVVSRDEEGNGFSPLHEIEMGAYDEESGECGILELTDELKKLGFTEEDVRGKPALIIWPSH